MRLIAERAWDNFFVHHLLAYGDGELNGTIAATMVLIAVVSSVNLSLNSSDVVISDGGWWLASCCVRCWQNLSQSTCCQFNLGEIGLWAITVSSVHDIGKWSVHGGWRLGCVKHWVKQIRKSLLQNRLSGHIRFLV